MKFSSLLMSVVVVMPLLGAGYSEAGAPVTAAAQVTAPRADPLEIPDALQDSINDALAACNGCFSNISAWEISPIASPNTVFESFDVLFDILDLDVQLPWAPRGQVPAQALKNLLTPSGQDGVLTEISEFADPQGKGFQIGAWKWSHMTQPDFCSSETLYLMYSQNTGVLFSFRFDSSSEC